MKVKVITGIMLTLLLASTLTLAFNIQSAKADPTTWTVDDDLQNYPDADFTKIQDAVDVAAAGDTINVYPGIYYENVDVNKSLSITSESGTKTTFVQSTKTDDWVFEIRADYVDVKGFTIKGYETSLIRPGGIGLVSANNCSILENHILGTSDGIQLYSSEDNTVANNNISNFRYNGIYLLQFSHGNTLTNNFFNSTHVGGDGIHLYGLSSNNKISNNTFMNSGLFVRYAYNNIIENNKVNGKPLLYLEGISNHVINGNDQTLGQIIIVGSSNIVVDNVHLANTNMGIEFFGTWNSRITNCNLTSNREGIYLGGSSNNIIENNLLSNNQLMVTESRNNIIKNNTFEGSGIHVHHYFSTDNVNHHILFNNFINCKLFLDRSLGNYIYINNFISSYTDSGVYVTANIWNTPLETSYTYEDIEYTNYLGNYWSDYMESDANNDGIGDSPYNTVWDDEDNYPLMTYFENYTYHPGIRVTSPNGGENWLVGSYQSIEWKSFLLFTSNVTVKLSTDGGSTWEEVLFANIVNDGVEEQWRVMGYPGDNLRIRVTSLDGSVVSDMSDSDFSITTISATNTFPEGYCTWWAFERRAQLGMPVDWLNDMSKPRDACKWIDFAKQAGVSTGSSPKTGAIAVWGATATNSFGHVAIVEWVEPGEVPGETWIGVSEMNYGSFIDSIEDITVNFRKVTDRTLTLPWPSNENFLGFIYGVTVEPGENESPVASAGQDMSVFSGDFVIFNGSKSYDPDGTIVSYQWDFGDETEEKDKIVSHRFRGAQNEAKTYTVTLTVEDDKGATDTDTIHITVYPLEETLEVSYQPAVGEPAYARMTVAYNWINDSHYVVSKVHYESGGFVGFGDISIWDMHSHSVPTPLWAAAIPSFWNQKTYYPKLQTVLYGGDTFEGISVEALDAMNIYIIGWAGISISTDPYSPLIKNFFFETASACFEPDSTEVPDVPIEMPNLYLAYLGSPGELRVYDSQAQVTGSVNGEIKEQIQNSACSNNTVVILSSSNSYRYEVAGTEEGSYGLIVASIIQGENNTFTALDIPISANAIHQYTIDWAALSQGEEGVAVQIDSDEDGTFEETFTSDSELTQDEFMLQVSSAEAFPWWILGVVAVVMVGVGATLVLWKRRKPNN